MANATTIIGSCDTRYREVAYMCEQVENQGMKAVVISVAAGSNPSYGYDVSREDVTKAAGAEQAELEPGTKGEKITLMTGVVTSYVGKLYAEGKTDGILPAGGPQNTVMAINTMKRLPIGFPRVMATTAASGRKTFESVVGARDIIAISSIYDFTGLNIMTRQIMANACACCTGMVRHVGQVLKKDDKPAVGATLTGITSTETRAAIDGLERPGIEPTGFHSIGAGGAIMEQMAADGLTDGILDLTTHEITQEYFKGGFSYGENAEYRLVQGVEKKAPPAVNVSGLDFINFQAGGFLSRTDGRIYMMHNANTAHIRLLPDEAETTTARFAARVKRIGYPVRLLIPIDRMRRNTRKGEAPYYKEVDDIIIRQLEEIRNPNVEVITIPGDLDTEEWGIQATYHMVDESKEHAVIGDKMQYQGKRGVPGNIRRCQKNCKGTCHSLQKGIYQRHINRKRRRCECQGARERFDDCEGEWQLSY